MSNKIIFVFILFIILRGYGYGQKIVKHHQLPAYVENDTLILRDVWVQTAKSQAQELKKLKTLQTKLDRVSVTLHQKKKLNKKALEQLNEIDSLRAVTDSLISKINNDYKGELKSLKNELNTTYSRIAVLQQHNQSLKVARKKLRIYSICSTGAIVILVIAII